VTERRKLGRIAPRTDRLSALPLFPDYTSRMPPPPPSVTWSDKVTSWPMLANDNVGDCTCAAVGHLIQLWTAVNGNPVVPTDREVLDFYSAVTGYDPGDPNTDQGAVMIDVLGRWRRDGIAVGGVTHKLAGFARCRVGHHDHVKSAINLMGGVCLGIAFQEQWSDRDVWDVGRGLRSEGGHEIPAVDYDKDTLTVVSWGRLYRMTWRALDRYCEEVQVPVAADWADSDLSPSGFDLQTLLADMGYLRGRPA
jgi:hypothetical protein